MILSPAEVRALELASNLQRNTMALAAEIKKSGGMALIEHPADPGLAPFPSIWNLPEMSDLLELALAMRDYAMRNGNAPVFAMSQSAFRQRWRWACGRLGIGHAPPPHSLRHTGPSEDLARRRASLEGVRRRGRWRSMDSVLRYTKTFALTKFKARMPEWSWRAAEAIAGDLRRSVRGAMSSPPAKQHGAAADTPMGRASGRQLHRRGLVGRRRMMGHRMSRRSPARSLPAALRPMARL